MTLSDLDTFTADSISKADDHTKPVFSLSTMNRLTTAQTPPNDDNDEDFGEFEVAPPQINAKIEQKTNLTLDLTAAAQQLEKTNEKQNMFDLLADLDFSAPPPQVEPQAVLLSESDAVTNEIEAETKESVHYLANHSIRPSDLAVSGKLIRPLNAIVS